MCWVPAVHMWADPDGVAAPGFGREQDPEYSPLCDALVNGKHDVARVLVARGASVMRTRVRPHVGMMQCDVYVHDSTAP